MTENEHGSQDIDLQEGADAKFHRGSALSVFHSDRAEDLIALLLAMTIALGVYLLVN